MVVNRQRKSKHLAGTADRAACDIKAGSDTISLDIVRLIGVVGYGVGILDVIGLSGNGISFETSDGEISSFRASKICVKKAQ